MNVNNYLTTVCQTYARNAKHSEGAKEVNEWLKSDPTKRTKIDDFAKEIFKKYPGLNARATSQSRYRQNPPDAKAWLLQTIFDKSFQQNPDKLVTVATKEKSSIILYPKWKTVTLIDVPKTIAKFFRSKIVQVAFAIVIAVATFFVLIRVYVKFSDALASMVPSIINRIPVRVIQTVNMISKKLESLKDRIILYSIYVFVGRLVILSLPPIRYITPLAESMDPWVIVRYISPSTSVEFAINHALNVGSFFSSIPQSIGHIFNGIAIKAENERMTINKEVCQKLWNEVSIDISKLKLA